LTVSPSTQVPVAPAAEAPPDASPDALLDASLDPQAEASSAAAAKNAAPTTVLRNKGSLDTILSLRARTGVSGRSAS